MADIVYSQSRLGSFDSCKLKYKYHYIDRLESDIDTIEAFRGSVVHKVLEELYKLVKVGTVKPVEWAERGLEGEVNSWMTWRAIKRFLLISSILTNAAFILILVGMALAEHATPTIPNTQQEQSFHAAPSQPFIP